MSTLIYTHLHKRIHVWESALAEKVLECAWPATEIVCVKKKSESHDTGGYCEESCAGDLALLSKEEQKRAVC